ERAAEGRSDADAALAIGAGPIGAVRPTAGSVGQTSAPARLAAGSIAQTSAPSRLAASPVGPAPPGEPPADSPHLVRRLMNTWSLPRFATTPELPRLPISHQSLEPPEFSWVGETARHIGTVVHAALEGYAGMSELPAEGAIAAERDFYVYQLRRHGVPEGDLPRATSIVIEALIRTVNSPRGRWIFAADHREARSEWALTGLAAGRLTNVVIDRTFIDSDGTRWVIDFKTSRHEGGGLDAFLEQEMARYRPQLETYVALA